MTAAKKYFGMIETARVRYHEGDGRVYLNRRKDSYDLILVDAFHGGYVPFHLLTKEFYQLIKQRLAPGGASRSMCTTAPSSTPRRCSRCGQCFPACISILPGKAKSRSWRRRSRYLMPKRSRARRALQDQHGFRFALPALLARRSENDNTTQTGQLLTDDFAPVNLYDTMGDKRRKK